MGAHPAVAAVRLAVRRALESHPVTVPAFVACSGGADSVALAAALAFESARSHRPSGLVCVDHGLQDGSAAQAARVAGLGFELGLNPVHVVKVDVGSNGGPEAAARTARYAALRPFRQLGGLVLLGHTADDQAETVLLGLGRGSGPRSIAGMRADRDGYLRPLLGLRRSHTEAACRALGLPVWQDPHNRDPRFRRSRLRHEVLPLLEDVLAGGVAEALARTAGQLQADLDALDQLAGLALAAAATPDGLRVDSLAGQPDAILTRVVKAWAEGAGAGPLAAPHIEQLRGLIRGWHGQGPIDLPGGSRAVRASGTLNLIAPVGHPPSGDGRPDNDAAEATEE